ncbi:MAG: BglI family type II restriction endonuclease [Aggregatilineales bacterium]
MTISQKEFFAIKTQLLKEPEQIIALERYYMEFLVQSISEYTNQIVQDFNSAYDLLPFWKNYPPLQRGRAPSGDAIPWSELGETVIVPHTLRSIFEANPSVQHPGLPSGADIRFATQNAFVHLDVKVTGPNDRADEIVASPNQISGDGSQWQNDAVANSPVTIQGQRSAMVFQPELAPLYVLDGQTLLCLTYFLKGVYGVQIRGQQPLLSLEIICVPNGLMAFTGVNYNVNQSGLFIPGKDEKKHRKKRTRVRMQPLADIALWRRQTLWKVK